MMNSSDTSEDNAHADSSPLPGLSSVVADLGLQRSLATYKYENALIKTELAATLDTHARQVEELKLKYQSQIKEVEKQRDEAEAKLSSLVDSQVEVEGKLQQGNLHLQQKMKMLEGDLEEAHRTRDKLAREKRQAEEAQQEMKRSHHTAVQAIKAEKGQLSERVDQLRGELDKERTTVRELTTTLTAEKHQHQLIQNRLSEVENKCEVQLNAAQTEVVSLQQEKDQEAATASKHISELMSIIEEEKALIQRVKERAGQTERELEKRLAEERQSGLSNTHQLTQQNAHLQEAVKSLEGKVRKTEAECESRVREAQEEVQGVRERLQAVEREKVVLEARLATLADGERLLRLEKLATSNLRQELHQQQAQVSQLNMRITDMQQHIHQLKTKYSEAKSQQSAAEEVVRREGDRSGRVVAELRATHQQEVAQLQASITDLETSLAEKTTRYTEECNSLKQKTRTYAQLIKKLRFKLEVGEVQVEQLEAQRAALQENIPPQAFRHLQTRLQDITRKHNEFAAFIRGLTEFHSTMPEIAELTTRVGAMGQRLGELEEEQQQCLSELESL